MLNNLIKNYGKQSNDLSNANNKITESSKEKGSETSSLQVDESFESESKQLSLHYSSLSRKEREQQKSKS